MERRKFLKQSCTFCLAAGAGLVIGSFSSCSTLPLYQTSIINNKVSVPLALFAQSGLQIIQPKNSYYNIALKKEENGTFTALLLKCTHADNQLNATGNGFKCNLHGSTFDQEGQVTKGPAQRALKQYPTEIINGQIIIHLT